MKAKDLDMGKIVWYKDLILGVKDLTLDKKYYECNVYHIFGNKYDYELIPYNSEMKEDLEKALAEQEADSKWLV